MLGDKPHVAFTGKKKKLSHFPTEISPSVENLKLLLSFGYRINSNYFKSSHVDKPKCF